MNILTFAIPCANMGMGKCKRCQAMHVLSSLTEHEASCRPEALIRQPDSHCSARAL